MAPVPHRAPTTRQSEGRYKIACMVDSTLHLLFKTLLLSTSYSNSPSVPPLFLVSTLPTVGRYQRGNTDTFPIPPSTSHGNNTCFYAPPSIASVPTSGRATHAFCWRLPIIWRVLIPTHRWFALRGLHAHLHTAPPRLCPPTAFRFMRILYGWLPSVDGMD